MKVEEMAVEYFESVCLHSYADTEEQLREDVVAAFLAGFRACAKKRLNATTISDCPIKDNRLTKAKEHIKQLLDCLKQDTNDPQTNYYVCQYMDKAEQFLKEIDE